MSKAILIADLPEPAEFVRQALRLEYTPVCVHAFDNALEAAETTQFDLIICGLHFDESRMMELLWKVKQLPQYENVPFLCIRALAAHPETTESVKTVHAALGAAGFVELANMDEESANNLRSEVEKLIGK
jgi:response regulator RpfG family c-di-GMP phosphodiesterase